MPTTLIVQIDGCDPAYLAAAETPTLDRIAREGWAREALAVVPSVTNVNSVSLVTGEFPEAHGIASNYRIDPATGEGAYVESAEFVRCPTWFERHPQADSLVLVAKEKLLRMTGRGARRALTAEAPPGDLIEACGEPASIYTAAINLWLFDACRHLLRCNPPALIYLATSDWVFHTYAPEEAEAQVYVQNLDTKLAELLDSAPDLELYVTADHGMNAKTRALNPAITLAEAGIDATLVPIIRDRYVAHHQNLGGAAYVYLRRNSDLPAARERIARLPGVEDVLTREEAATRFRLPADAIGELMLLADVDTVFGELPRAEQRVSLRSHGSVHEQRVPLYARNASVTPAGIQYHLDVTRSLAAR